MGLLLSLSDKGERVPERALGGSVMEVLVTHVSLFLGALCW